MNDNVLQIIDKLCNGVAVDLSGLKREEKLYVECCMFFNSKDYKNSINSINILYSHYGILDMNLAISCLYFYLTTCDVADELVEEFYLVLSDHEHLIDKQQQSVITECVNKYIEKQDNPCKSVIKNFKKYIVRDYFQDLQSMLDFDKLRSKNVINAYYNSSSSGVGDFLRGCCYLVDLFNDKGVHFSISFHNHDLGSYLESQCKSEPSIDKIFDTERHNKEYATEFDYFRNMEDNLVDALNNSKNNDIIIFSNYSHEIGSKDGYTVSEECKSFMQENIIFSEDVEQRFTELDLIDYQVVHFRLGDHECSSHLSKVKLDNNNINTKKFDIDYEKLAGNIVSTYLKHKKTIVVMSDSNRFKQYINENIINQTNYDIRIVHQKSQHSSDNPGFVESLEIDRLQKITNMYYVALDMKILSKSQKIDSFSVYPWGSGFCYWIARIFDIDIQQNSV